MEEEVGEKTAGDARPAAVELFAGVGGFRLGLEAAGWEVAWSNQWEPSTNVQHASWCYEHVFGPAGHVCADIEKVLDRAVDGDTDAVPDHEWTHIPDHRLLVGGFPCQDYSVAKPLNIAHGIVGKKGVLWWQINRWVEHFKPDLVLLENVDRLLNSPRSQRGRDFAVMLSCFARLDYTVTWRVINAADYGFPQKRRRVFLLAERNPEGDPPVDESSAVKVATSTGVLAKALPLDPDTATSFTRDEVGADPFATSQSFGKGLDRSPWGRVGVMANGVAWSGRAEPDYKGVQGTILDVLQDAAAVPDAFDIPQSEVAKWKAAKGAKRQKRESSQGHKYTYVEGNMRFPDPIDEPARTILTSEGGRSPNRARHAIRTPEGRLRRLTPVELEKLNGFPPGHTAEMATPDGVKEMTDNKRAFMMGNALVVGIVERIAKELPRG